MGVQAEPAEGVGPDVGEEDVGPADQALGRLAGFGLRQIEHNTALSPVVEGERRNRQVGVEADGAEHGAERITGG